MLTHDGVPLEGSPLDARPGEPTSLTGELVPFEPPRATVQRWAPATAILENHTYELAGMPADLLVLVTSGQPLPTREPLVIHGDVLLRAPHPDQPWRTILVVREGGVNDPILR